MDMDLYVVRHAIAEERRADLPDPERALTKRGRARFERSVVGLEALGIHLERVLTSPWARAAETAAFLLPIASARPILEEGLARDPDEDLLMAIASARVPTALVGHEPWLSELVAWLVVGDARGGDARFAMKKGGVAHLRGIPRPGEMQLRALLPPKVLLAIGG